VASVRHHNGLPDRFLDDSLGCWSAIRKPACASTAKTAFEIMSFNLQASDEPLVCYIRRIRVAGARGIKSKKASRYSLIFHEFFA
jgi:hypothetical protein